MKAIQDYYSPEFAHCFGCGPANAQGLRLKSHVEGDETVARFVPPAYYTGGFPGHVYGGIIASLLDCHGAASAAAFAHCDRGRSLGDGGPPIRFVTASLMSIPAKAPGNYEIMAPIDSWMMPPPGNGMMAPGSWGLLADNLLAPETAPGQEVIALLARERRRLSPVSSMRWALWTRRSMIASA